MAPELKAALERAKVWDETATPEQKEAMWKAQRESYVRAEASWPAPKFEMVNRVKVYASYEDYCNG